MTPALMNHNNEPAEAPTLVPGEHNLGKGLQVQISSSMQEKNSPAGSIIAANPIINKRFKSIPTNRQSVLGTSKQFNSTLKKTRTLSITGFNPQQRVVIPWSPHRLKQ